MITTKNLYEVLKVHENTIYNYVKEGMPHVYVGGKYLFDLDQVLKWLKDRRGD